MAVATVIEEQKDKIDRNSLDHRQRSHRSRLQAGGR